MPRLRKVAATSAKVAVPVLLAARLAGPRARAAYHSATVERSARAAALAHAESAAQGAILEVRRQGTRTWVVFSEGAAVAAYPPVADLEVLVAGANLSKKVTPERFRAHLAERSAPGRALASVEGALSRWRRARRRL
jgi:hypothetical protein